MLKSRIDECYGVFARYPLKDEIDSCPHCELADAETSLHRAELKELGWDDLRMFIYKSMTTFGDVDDFKHFLPRIMELYINDFFEAPYDFGIVLSKLEYARWLDWPAAEFNSIKDLLDGWMRYLQESTDDLDRQTYEDICNDIAVYESTYTP